MPLKLASITLLLIGLYGGTYAEAVREAFVWEPSPGVQYLEGTFEEAPWFFTDGLPLFILGLGAMCVVSAIALFVGARWGRWSATVTLGLALLYRGAALFDSETFGDLIGGVVSILFVVILMSLVHDPRVDAWFAAGERHDEAAHPS